MTVGADRLYEELAFVAYYLHWPHGELLDMDHLTRRRYLGEISRINQQISDSASGASTSSW